VTVVGGPPTPTIGSSASLRDRNRARRRGGGIRRVSPAGGSPPVSALRSRSRALARLAVLSLALPGLSCASDRPAEWHEGEDVRWRELRVRGGEPGFSPVDPAAAGIAYRNEMASELIVDNEILANGSGVALGDVDGDGRVDLFLPGIAGTSALYRNLGGWRFEDVTDADGLGDLAGHPARGAALADVDGDGDLDLLVTLHAEPDRLYLNDGAGVFGRMEAGFETRRAGHSLALADADGDGDLDLYVTNYKDHWARDLFPPSELTFDRLFRAVGDSFLVRPEYADQFRVQRTEEGWRRQELAQPDDYYVNEGGGRFRRVSLASGAFADESGTALGSEPEDWGLAVRFGDLDGDGDPDLYVANDLSSPDRAWLNRGDGTFRAISPLALRTVSLASMAVDASDIDGDGDEDLLVAEMLARDPVRRRMQLPDIPFDPPRPGEVATRRQVHRNTLQMNRGDGTFAEVAYYAGLAASGWTWGVRFEDVDLDGREDLLAVTGHVLDFMHGDAQMTARASVQGPDWRRARLVFPRLEIPNVSFRNLGGLRFEDTTDRWGFAAGNDISNALSAGDLDGDGDADIVVNRLDAAPLLLRNDTGAARIAVRLRGRAPNTQGIGATVRVTAAGLPLQLREVTEGGLYLSDPDGQETFATGRAGVVTVEVRWPSGAVRRLEARPNRLYELAEPEAAAGSESAATPSPGAAGAAERPGGGGEPGTGPLLEDVSARLGHRHVEPVFDEFARQPLLPERLSQLGPGITWFDADGDGDPDLLLPDGASGRLTELRNDEGTLRAAGAHGPVPYDETTVLGLATASRRGLLVGQSVYEAASSADARATPTVIGLRVGSSGPSGPPVPVAAGAPSAAGPLALADVDRDGDLDLFVGGRVIPTAYPAPATSRLLLNEGGSWREDDANRDLLSGIGLVSGAAFSDVDGDGDPDLWLALDWGPPTLLRNDDGRLVDATRALALDGLAGRWNGVATGDLDGDGRPDAVLTGWGENTEYALGPGAPVLVYGDLDRNGTLDVFEAKRVSADRSVPLRRMDQLARGLPAITRLVRTHERFARMSVEELVGDASVSSTAEARELRHLVLLNRGDRFEPVPLPPEAQLAPAFGVAVTDLDGDGAEDVLLAQNFFAVSLEGARLDAGRGLWLRGGGDGSLRPVPAPESGVYAYGDGRGLAVADYDADGRVDVAIAQNGADTKLFHNVRGAPGIRVRLVGPPGNADAVGAAIRLVYAGRRGPVREVQAGSGYWSQNEALQVLGGADGAVGVWVRWPDGTELVRPLEPGERDITVRWSARTDRGG